MKSSFKNKVVWITGASSGIGEALAKELATRGAKLVLSARNTQTLNAIKKQLQLDDSRCIVLKIDLEHESNFSNHVLTVVNNLGAIDILINNAGISQRSFAVETSIEVDKKIMQVNYFGTVTLTKAILPHMIKNNSGHIVAISSIAGKIGYFLRTSYSASKHALHGFFDSLRMEVYKNNVKVLLVCPGKIKTNISVNALTGTGEKHNIMDDSHLRKGVISAEDCANQILAAIEKGKEEIYIGDARGKLGLLLKRLIPATFSKIIRKQKIE
ncbi:MAG: SDR family oxidoreductase [Bacteroidetes bacterium]|nr:SDR family oxidoreductase [Bacteroidota bacterium]